MSKKSLLFIGAGVLLILSAVLMFVEGGLFYYANLRGNLDLILGGRGAALRFELFTDEMMRSRYLRAYMENMTFMSWVRILIPALVGCVLIAKAVLPDLVPDIAIVAGFGILALLTLLALGTEFLNMFREPVPSWYGENGYQYRMPHFSEIIGGSIGLLATALSLVGFAGVAALFFFKDKFANLALIPAIAAAGSAFLIFLINIGMPRNRGIWAGTLVWSVGASLVLFLFDCITIGALLAMGLAAKEN